MEPFRFSWPYARKASVTILDLCVGSGVAGGGVWWGGDSNPQADFSCHFTQCRCSDRKCTTVQGG